MADRNEIGVVYRAGLVHGVALVAMAMGLLSFVVIRGRRPAVA